MGRKLEAVIMLRVSDDLKVEAEKLAKLLDRPLSWVARQALERMIAAEKEKQNG